LLKTSPAKQTLPGLPTLEILGSVDFASKKQNQSWRSPRKAA
jgi:hypothetical protein